MGIATTLAMTTCFINITHCPKVLIQHHFIVAFYIVIKIHPTISQKLYQEWSILPKLLLHIYPYVGFTPSGPPFCTASYTKHKTQNTTPMNTAPNTPLALFLHLKAPKTHLKLVYNLTRCLESDDIANSYEKTG